MSGTGDEIYQAVDRDRMRGRKRRSVSPESDNFSRHRPGHLPKKETGRHDDFDSLAHVTSRSPRHDYRRSRSMSSSPHSRRDDHESRPVQHPRRSLPRRRNREEEQRSRALRVSRSPPRSSVQNIYPEDRHTRRKRREPHSSSHRERSRFRSPKRRRRSDDTHTSPVRPARKPLPSQDESYRGKAGEVTDAVGPPVEKEKPNFRPTGLLAAETNKVVIGSGNTAQDVVLKYHEPPEARKPSSSEPWVLYIFKGTSPDPLHTVQLHSRSCWLLGRELAVADIPVEHPSCSKQHAVFQFRHIVKRDEWGERKGKVHLYILDLESSNGTYLNGQRLEAARYTECLTGDVLKFGDSEREYVLLLPPKL